MPLRLPPLAALRIFEAAARLGSFRKAAEELHLTPSAVSHGIETLERWIGAPLFVRKGRSVSLAAAGEDLLPYVAQGLSMIAVGAKRVSPLQGARRVAVSAASTFVSHWLVPRLPRFQQRHPDIAIAVDTAPRRVLFAVDDVDVAIRMGAEPWPGTRSHLLFREALVPVAAPPMISRIVGRDGRIRWERAVLLHVSPAVQDWDTWLNRHGLDVDPRNNLFFDTARLAVDAAALGLGIALARLPLCAPDLDGGRVAALAYPSLEIETGYWLTLPADGEPRRDVEAFLRWIMAEAGSQKDEFHSSQ